MKAYWGSGGIAPCILYLGTRWTWVVSFTSRPLYPRGGAPGTHWIGSWVGLRAVLDAVVKRKIPSPHQESNPRTPIFQPVAQPYIDWAITAVSCEITPTYAGPCHHCLARRQVTDGGDGLQLWRIVTNTLIRVADSRQGLVLQLWNWARDQQLSRVKVHLPKCYTESRNWTDSLERPTEMDASGSG
jgi:hypothetical protein